MATSQAPFRRRPTRPGSPLNPRFHCRRAKAGPAIWASAVLVIRIQAQPRLGSCCRHWPWLARPAHNSEALEMVGLVLVSHSRKLAEAVRELVQQTTNSGFPVAVAA